MERRKETNFQRWCLRRKLDVLYYWSGLQLTTGAYQTAISKAVNTLFREGKNVAEIQELTSVQSYLPYSKTVYKMEERTLLAERLQKYRIRKSEVEKIAEAMASGRFAASAWVSAN